MLFSVIVPIYNVEGYLERCIESVREQDFDDFELILVDDGSPDRCPGICDEYAKIDQRIKVIHKENGGLVSARQIGIKIAQGEYILNLDSDDAITSDTLLSAYKIISDTHPDIISFSYICCDEGVLGEVISDSADEGLYNKEKIKSCILPQLLMGSNMNHMTYYLAGKIIKRELLITHQLNVSPRISLGEDLCCVVPCYLQADSVYVSKTQTYLYTKRNNSISKDFNTKQIRQIEDVINVLKNMNLEKPEDFSKQIARYSCFMCFAILAAAAQGNHFKSIKNIKYEILNSIHESEIKKAEFNKITIKSRIGIFLMKKKNYTMAFYFLYLCKEFKRILKRED